MADQLRREKTGGKVFVNFGMLNCVRVCARVCVHVHVQVCMYACVCMYMCVCVCNCMGACACMCITVYHRVSLIFIDESPILFPPTYRYKTNITSRTVEDYVWIKQKRSGVSKEIM